MYLPLRSAFRWTFEGIRHVPVSGPVLLASNHVSYLDPFTIGYLCLLRQRRVRFLAKQELFEKPGLGWIFENARHIPVARGTYTAAGSLDAAAGALHAGELVCVFPEGTISPGLDPMPAKTGTARLAIETGVPVVPLGVWGSHRILTKHRKPKPAWGIAQTMVVGPPLQFTPDDDVYLATDAIMAAIVHCVARAREIYPQREPGAWWDRSPEAAVLRPTPRR